MGNTLALLKQKTSKQQLPPSSDQQKNYAEQQQESKALAEHAAELAISKKASNVNLMNLIGLADMTDYFVVCTADSDKHAKAITDHILEGLREVGEKPSHVEGISEAKWILLDFFNVVIHIFLKETRQFYNIERVWGDAEITAIKDSLSDFSGVQPSLKLS